MLIMVKSFLFLFQFFFYKKPTISFVLDQSNI